jgi:hypothetical protein
MIYQITSYPNAVNSSRIDSYWNIIKLVNSSLNKQTFPLTKESLGAWFNFSYHFLKSLDQRVLLFGAIPMLFFYQRQVHHEISNLWSDTESIQFGIKANTLLRHENPFAFDGIKLRFHCCYIHYWDIRWRTLCNTHNSNTLYNSSWSTCCLFLNASDILATHWL